LLRAAIKPTGNLSVHTLRKYYAVNLFGAGVPVDVVRELMGHSGISKTIRYYNEVTPDRKVQAAKDLGSLLSDPQESDASGWFWAELT
jgi:integrase